MTLNFQTTHLWPCYPSKSVCTLFFDPSDVILSQRPEQGSKVAGWPTHDIQHVNQYLRINEVPRSVYSDHMISWFRNLGNHSIYTPHELHCGGLLCRNHLVSGADLMQLYAPDGQPEFAYTYENTPGQFHRNRAEELLSHNMRSLYIYQPYVIRSAAS